MPPQNLVEGFNVDTQSPKPDRIACTESKQFVEPFNQTTNRQTEPGELTHIDLWGKYDIASINGNHYYILLIDDSERYITTDFLKRKDEAAQKVIEYVAYLLAQGKKPKAIRIDRGKEFVNEKLNLWCREHGIEIQMTAPYSPSQNGVAERMNCTLVELARAMIKNLPEFLWEYAINHSTYIRNRSYTKSLNNQTPYERRFKRKPNISHLREFGAPIWVLLQGQKIPRKMEPKSKRRVFVGFDDGSKSIKYYNAETRKILTSRNFRFLSLSDTLTPPEEIVVSPTDPREGEAEGSTLPMGNSILKRNERMRIMKSRIIKDVLVVFKWTTNIFITLFLMRRRTPMKLYSHQRKYSLPSPGMNSEA